MVVVVVVLPTPPFMERVRRAWGGLAGAGCVMPPPPEKEAVAYLRPLPSGPPQAAASAVMNHGV